MIHIYLIIFPGLGTNKGVNNWTQIKQYEQEVEETKKQIAPIYAKYTAMKAEDIVKDPKAMAIGERLFMNNCAQCHGVSGRGGALSEGGVAPSLMDSDAKNIYQAMISGPQNMPVFSDSTLPVEDKQAIIAYIEQLQKGENPGGNGLGRLGPVTEGLFIWVVGLGALLAVAIWIGAKAK